MLLEAQLAALRWAVKAKAEAFMDSVRQAIAGAPDGRDGSRHRQTAEIAVARLNRGKYRSVESHYVAFGLLHAWEADPRDRRFARCRARLSVPRTAALRADASRTSVRCTRADAAGASPCRSSPTEHPFARERYTESAGRPPMEAVAARERELRWYSAAEG